MVRGKGLIPRALSDGECERARRTLSSRLSFVLPALLLALAACKETPKPADKPAAPVAGPATRATVITIRSTMTDSPDAAYDIVIANGRARSTEELDTWRLIDTGKKEVTFVDDLAKTYSTVPFQTLLTDRTAANGRPLDPDLQRAQVLASGKTQKLQGVAAAETVIRLGAYERHLWIGTPGGVPPELFAMMQLSHPATSSLAPVMRDVDAHLAKLNGFALSDTTELPYGKKKLVAQRSVTAITQKDVQASLFEIPKGYAKVAYVTPILPAARRASSPAMPSPTTAAAPVAPAPVVVTPAPAPVTPVVKPPARPAAKPAVKPAAKKPAAKPKATVKKAPPKRTKVAPKPAPKPPVKKKTPPKKKT